MTAADRIEELKAIARATVHETLTTLGIDASDPLQAQQDFGTMRDLVKLARDPEYRKDWEHARKWRLAIESATSKGFLAVVGIIVSGAAGALWLGIKAAVGK